MVRIVQFLCFMKRAAHVFKLSYASAFFSYKYNTILKDWWRQGIAKGEPN